MNYEKLSLADRIKKHYHDNCIYCGHKEVGTALNSIEKTKDDNICLMVGCMNCGWQSRIEVSPEKLLQFCEELNQS